LDQHRRLVIGRSREDLALPSRDDGIPRDQLGEHATGRLDTESQRVDVDEEDTVREATFAGENSTLNSGAIGDGFIWVDRFGGLFAAEEFLDELLDLGDTSGTTDEDDLPTS
jgi:NAD-specific glutamate dehydrogenase